MTSSSGHTPEHGPRKTRKWVLVADKIADRFITVGGILVIAAVTGMLVFLVYEVLPLFRGGSIQWHTTYRLTERMEGILALGMDEYKTLACAICRDGRVFVWHVETGTPLKTYAYDFGGKNLTAFSHSFDLHDLAFGFSDGTARFVQLRFRADIIPEGQAPPNLKKITESDSTDGTAVFSVVPGNQIRKVSVELETEADVGVSETRAPLVALDCRVTRFGERPKKILAAIDARGDSFLTLAESKQNLFTRKVQIEASTIRLPSITAETAIGFALVNHLGDEVYFAERSGKVYRFNTADPSNPQLAETLKLLPEGVQMTVFSYLLGEQSLLVGASDGSVRIFFRLPQQDTPTSDGFTLVHTRTFESQKAAVTSFSPSQRSKTFAITDAQGNVSVNHATSEQTLLRWQSPELGQDKSHKIMLAPRLDGLMAMTSDGHVDIWGLYIPHPETSLRTLFGKVWYEGYPSPSYTWQSTGGTEAFEPKLSLVPLIFGTIKATVYSLMFAIPIALLGAIYTSEFLPLAIRARVKPVMEVMASIPSVVLGFVAALVLSPVVETWIAAVLLGFLVVPCVLICLAFVWQLVPPTVSIRFEGIPKFVLMMIGVAGGLYVAILMGPPLERIFFGGDFKGWLNGGAGSSVPFVFLLMFPITAVAASLTVHKLWGRKFDLYLREIRMPYSALLDLARWLGMVLLAGLLALVLAWLFTWLGFDPRGSFVGTYVQRNTLIVGFAMGFAVIPLIYTLAEDALQAVPEHLRSASLGCGATPWQTAIWIILPTAISGVFSAVMIGMGRAVGETMIVVMSAGNTPLLDWNIFNGLRALSANIAVELPEAPKGGSLYRVLFLTGLVLFAMTFVINTIAELVRIRFRKRAMTL